MNTPIHLEGHLSEDEISERYRQAKEGVAKSHWQMIWLLSRGKTTQEIADVTGYSARWVRCLVRRYNQQGPEALGDRRHENPGGKSILSEQEQTQLQEALDAPSPDEGLWTGPKVAVWMKQQTGREVHPQRGWEYLRRLRYSKRVLRPRHAKADPQEQEAFKKTVRAKVPTE